MSKPTMYKARFYLWNGETFVDDMGWLNHDGIRAKETRERMARQIAEGVPFWTYSNIVFPDSLRRVEFFWDDNYE